MQLNWCPARRHGKVVTGAQNRTAVTSSPGEGLVKEGRREKVAMEHHKQHDKALLGVRDQAAGFCSSSGVLHDIRLKHVAWGAAFGGKSCNTVSYKAPDDLVMAKHFPRSLLLPSVTGLAYPAS